MPITGSHLFGRDAALAILDDAWSNETINLLSLVAWAGVGKSTLLNHWLSRMAMEDYRGARRVFAWSFYTQGTTERVVAADLFIEATLRAFGDPDPLLGSPWDRAERLAALIRSTPTLLILDGLEPLQYPPGHDEGRLRDNTLAVLLTELASSNDGLCVVSTRLPITNLTHFESSTAPRHDLDDLSPDAGAALLRASGVWGDDTELMQASRDFGGHALALSLLGSFLEQVYAGDIRHRREIPPLESDNRLGGHALRVLNSYEDWLGEGPDLALLRLLGLFDRSVSQATLDAVLTGEPLPGLTEGIAGLARLEWDQLLGRLRHARLISAGSSYEPGRVDVHPLVREHFGRRAKDQFPSSWRDANARLFHHYCLAAPPQPRTVEEMEPLFLAVVAACNAELHQEAFDTVYRPRIMRDDEQYAATVLVVHSALLYVLSHFFVGGDWRRPHPALKPHAQLTLLMDAGYHLTAVRGYAAREVGDCYSAAQTLCESLGDNASLFGVRLAQCRLYRLRGDLARSLGVARELERNAGEADPMVARALASTLFYTGHFETTARYAAVGDVQYPPAQALANARLDVNDPAVSCAGYLGLAQTLLGAMGDGLDNAARAARSARALEHGHTWAVAQLMLTMVHQFRREPQLVVSEASKLTQICSAGGFDLWRIAGEILEAWAHAYTTGQHDATSILESKIAQWRAMGALLFLPYWYGLLADVAIAGVPDIGPGSTNGSSQGTADKALDLGLSMSQQTGETWWDPELRRLRAILLGRHDPSIAEEELLHARAIARFQRALLPELRIAIARTELSVAIGVSDGTANELATILERFPKSTDTKDVRYAAELLDRI